MESSQLYKTERMYRIIIEVYGEGAHKTTRYESKV